MTDKQKNAILTLNRIRDDKGISEDEYFTLLEFVIEDKKESITYIPFQPYPSLPAQPDITWRTTSSQEIK